MSILIVLLGIVTLILTLTDQLTVFLLGVIVAILAVLVAVDNHWPWPPRNP